MVDSLNKANPAKPDWRLRVNEFTSSEVFERLFREGMTLVEEAATYLDGDGRQESRKLDRQLALTYAAESMEVTTRLMQTASWLVVQRAIRENDMTVDEAAEEKYRLAAAPKRIGANVEQMPAELRILIERSRAIYERVYRLDDALYATKDDEPEENPVISQIDRLRDAAENGAFDPLAIWRKN